MKDFCSLSRTYFTMTQRVVELWKIQKPVSKIPNHTLINEKSRSDNSIYIGNINPDSFLTIQATHPSNSFSYQHIRRAFRWRGLQPEPQRRRHRGHGQPRQAHKRLPILHHTEQGPLVGRQTRRLRQGRPGNGTYHPTKIKFWGVFLVDAECFLVYFQWTCTWSMNRLKINQPIPPKPTCSIIIGVRAWLLQGPFYCTMSSNIS